MPRLNPDSRRKTIERAPAARPVKRSLAIGGHATSISLEQAFWDALKDAAASEQQSIVQLVARIDAGRGSAGLSSAVRVWLLEHYRYHRRGPPSGADNL
jgi:predicted DNA-binding ribbon-helix-helix protein